MTLFVFDDIGFGQWFRYFTGAVEVMGAVMLFVAQAALIGVGLLVCTMIGALLVHALVIGIGPQALAVCVLLIMLLVVGIRRIADDAAHRESSVKGKLSPWIGPAGRRRTE